MQKEIKIWIEALESSKYKQGINALCRVEEGVEFFCCLGVLLDTLQTPKVECPDYTNRISFLIDGYNENTTLPSEFAKKYGLAEHILYDLIQLNDVYKNTFPEIAAHLKNVKELQ